MKVGILSALPHGWDVPWQVKHPVLTRLAERAEVVWMAPPVPRNRILERRPLPTVYAPMADLPSLRVYHPERWLPHLYRPAPAAAWLTARRIARGRRLLEQRGCDTFVLYLWRPEPSLVENSSGFDLRVYHIDDEYTFTTEDMPTPARERWVLEHVDQVIIHSQTLVDKKGAFNPHTARVPNGVDYMAYATPREEPTDLAATGRPRVGYVGFLKRQLDWPLLEKVVAGMPDLEFVFIGPISPHQEVPEAMRRLSDLGAHFLGAKQPAEVPAYAQHLDVCIMPYRIDGYTRYIYPLKLHEYLAAGRPVVATPIPALRPFGHVVSLARSPREWMHAVRESLRPEATTEAERERRRAVARENDWGTLTGRIWDLIRQRLEAVRGATRKARIPR